MRMFFAATSRPTSFLRGLGDGCVLVYWIFLSLVFGRFLLDGGSSWVIGRDGSGMILGVEATEVVGVTDAGDVLESKTAELRV